jgi:hypothetical protein
MRFGEWPVGEILVGARHRKDFGDIAARHSEKWDCHGDEAPQ